MLRRMGMYVSVPAPRVTHLWYGVLGSALDYYGSVRYGVVLYPYVGQISSRPRSPLSAVHPLTAPVLRAKCVSLQLLQSNRRILRI